ncbi:hypothetical protein AN3820.2 [Aspergillus nidulans FGSC A4]|uniref:Uncharacterized protein n=1 Tax=Emericella nidulans (strain FGSC A4 / ATCC 38163 / CBS 112.46 / NRRL 194 / M139) TaxID=227321 RepID=Q5B6L0_EMENI|nr:hypothetical protein [Aspergillus nidulans FGSC A4]EAA60028.1 hypothetical protein AN3820.2 [Aspergillus nidulans FGSC A4]CBF75314.1 TPA: hypothetical protein ANIA_03820 [Aspergillus nidulans FGSC A4]|eukprot:XP_661424.1 hypothetical protein AN3820.2 [Aspergillus nidulans FGSC A4]
MHLFNPIDSLDPYLSLSRRQSDSNSSSVCGGGGVGTGVKESFTQVNANILLTMRNRDNQTCAGEYVVGNGSNSLLQPDYPCVGPDYIVCCVEWEDMVNVTSNSSPSTDTTTTTTRTTTTNSPTPGLETGADGSGSGGGDGGLSASQKGGIAGGIVGAVAVTSIIFLLFLLLRRRRKQQQHGQEQPVVEESEGRRSDYTGEGKGTERETSGHNVGGGENEIGVAMLASREKAELDASGRALHEMESPTVTKNIKEIGGYRELDGTPLAIAELAVPETGPEHGQNGQKGKTGHEQAP